MFPDASVNYGNGGVMEFWIFGSLVLLGVVILNRGKIYLEWRTLRTDWKSWLLKFWKEWGEPLLFAIVIAFFIRHFALGPYKIPSGSMRPTLLEGDRIFVDKLSYRFYPPKRGDIIVFRYPLDPKKDFVKRLIAFQDEEVEIRDGAVYIGSAPLDKLIRGPSPYYYNKEEWSYGKTGQKIKVPDGSFFVLGDNSAHSSDSRNWGFVPKRNLIGRAFLIWWPFRRFGFVS